MSKTAGRPYPGSRPFRQADRDRFFGRTAEADLLAEWWKNNHLTFVVGQAGRGKTSLLKAGVLPRLAEAAEKVTVLPIGRLSHSATFPLAALPAQNPYTLALLSSWAPNEIITRLAGLTVGDFIQRLGGTVLAVIDQADQLLADTGPRQAHRRRFLEELDEALRAGELHLLVVAREEAAGVMADALGGGIRLDLTPLTWQGAVDAVSLPVAGVGRSFADGVAERLVTDLQTSHITAADGSERHWTEDRVEPALLQAVCARFWDSLPDVDLITARDVRRHGDADTALATWCGMVIARIADDHELPAKRLASWLLNNFVTENGTRDRKREGATNTAGMPNASARGLEDRHLLIARLESGSRWYELLSDRLIEPLRKAAEMNLPLATSDDNLRAAEHAFTLGELDLAERYAQEILVPRWNLAYGCTRRHSRCWATWNMSVRNRRKPRVGTGRRCDCSGSSETTGRWLITSPPSGRLCWPRAA